MSDCKGKSENLEKSRKNKQNLIKMKTVEIKIEIKNGEIRIKEIKIKF